jgi:hypothetical protein
MGSGVLGAVGGRGCHGDLEGLCEDPDAVVPLRLDAVEPKQWVVVLEVTAEAEPARTHLEG